MHASKGYSRLLKAAADLARHQFLPSWASEDYETKTMSTARLADRMGHVSEQLKVIALEVRKGADALLAERDALQAKIDALMLEFCPDEMTPEQKENWARHQRRAQPSRENDRTAEADDEKGQSVGREAAPQATQVQGFELTLTGRQVLDALGFVAPDCFTVTNRDSEVEFARQTFDDEMASEVTIARLSAHRTAEGEERPAGVYAWMAEYPEEGSILLGQDTSDGKGG